MARTAVSRMPGSAPTFPTVPRRLVFAITIGLSCVVGVVLFSRFNSRSADRLESLSTEQRLSLYRRTLADLELCAGEVGEALKNHCAHQASLIARFAECDGHCRTLAARWQTRATR